MIKLVTIFLFMLLLVVGAFIFFTTEYDQKDEFNPKLPVDTADLIVTNEQTDKEVMTSATVSLPLLGSAPSEDVLHTIEIEDIRRGCFRQDCIPSVDNPEFVTVEKANQILPDDTIGIALSYQGVDRFYPFNMLVTREIVNDVINNHPVLVTYCPLCGTGIVFERSVDGEVFEFGVSGMLWQSNLLMYNRAEDLDDRNLWSQVLGEAVVGNFAGKKLNIIPSDIQKYGEWSLANPHGEVLNTGKISDPYNGRYFDTARRFAPDFDEANSKLDPSTYVYGIELEGTYVAFPADNIPVGESSHTVNGKVVHVMNEDGKVAFTDQSGSVLPDVEGFWFSWQAAYPETLLESLNNDYD